MVATASSCKRGMDSQEMHKTKMFKVEARSPWSICCLFRSPDPRNQSPGSCPDIVI